MKRYRIAVQDGLNELKDYLSSLGFEIVGPGREMQADVTIITNDEEELDESEPARVTYTDRDRKKRILIYATHLTHEQVLELLTFDWKRNRH